MSITLFSNHLKLNSSKTLEFGNFSEFILGMNHELFPVRFRVKIALYFYLHFTLWRDQQMIDILSKV